MVEPTSSWVGGSSPIFFSTSDSASRAIALWTKGVAYDLSGGSLFCLFHGDPAHEASDLPQSPPGGFDQSRYGARARSHEPSSGQRYESS